jgi:hypothetical protein
MNQSRRNHRDTSVVLATTLLFALGCAGETGDSSASLRGTVRDSAGVQIVEHAGIPSSLPVWTIADSAEVRIGSVDGTGPEVFGRIAGLALLPGGTIVVAESQAPELRAFDRGGAHVWSAGRRGEGPGEFIRTIAQLSALGEDSLLVSDGGGRTMVFGPDGTYARQLRLAEPREGIARVRIIGALDDGTLVSVYSSMTIGGDQMPTGITRGSEEVALLDSSGAVGDGMGEYRSAESTIKVTRSASGQIGSVEVRRLAMGRGSVFAVGANSVVAGETDAFALTRYDGASGQTRIIRVSMPQVLLDESARQRTLELDSLAIVSDTLPAFGLVRVDDVGRIWVQEFVPVYEQRAADWYVFDGDGAFVARVTLPYRFDPRVFAGDEVWGVRPDELDVSYVERYVIRR